MIITRENIWKKIKKKKNYLEVLKSDLVDQVKDSYGWTPLHILAWNGFKDVLSHPSVDKVKNNEGYTPLHFLAYWSYLTEEDLRKKYPWYKKEITNILKAVKNIENTPKSIQFILED